MRAGAASYAASDYDQAGLTVESWTDPETGDTTTSTPHRDTVYQAGGMARRFTSGLRSNKPL